MPGVTCRPLAVNHQRVRRGRGRCQVPTPAIFPFRTQTRTCSLITRPRWSSQVHIVACSIRTEGGFAIGPRPSSGERATRVFCSAAQLLLLLVLLFGFLLTGRRRFRWLCLLLLFFLDGELRGLGVLFWLFFGLLDWVLAD